MKEELNERLLAGLDKVTEWAEKTGDFVVDQAPLVVQEILRYNFALSLITQVFCLLALTAIGVVFYKLLKCVPAWLDDEHTGLPKMFISGMLALISGLGFIPALVITFLKNGDWLQIWLAPRLYIIEYVSALIK